MYFQTGWPGHLSYLWCAQIIVVLYIPPNLWYVIFPGFWLKSWVKAGWPSHLSYLWCAHIIVVLYIPPNLLYDMWCSQDFGWNPGWKLVGLVTYHIFGVHRLLCSRIYLQIYDMWCSQDFGWNPEWKLVGLVTNHIFGMHTLLRFCIYLQTYDMWCS